jgi:hypothetical protein
LIILTGERKFDGLVAFANTLGVNDEGQVVHFISFFAA